MGRILKDEKIKGFTLKFYKTDKTGWVRTHIINTKGDILSSYDSRNKIIARQKAKDFIEGKGYRPEKYGE